MLSIKNLQEMKLMQHTYSRKISVKFAHKLRKTTLEGSSLVLDDVNCHGMTL